MSWRMSGQDARESIPMYLSPTDPFCLTPTALQAWDRHVLSMFCCFIYDVFSHQYYTTSGESYQTEASADALVVLYWLEESLLLLQDVLLWMAMTEQSTLFMSPGHWQWSVYSLVKTSPSSWQAVFGHINHMLLLTVGTATDSCPNKLHTVV